MSPVAHLRADVSSEQPEAVRVVLDRLEGCTVTATDSGWRVEGELPGDDPRELNRVLLSSLRRVERRTRLRAEWTAGGVTTRFFDYVMKSQRPAVEN